MLADLLNQVVPNVSTVQGNAIDSDERVSFARLSAARIPAQIDAADWSDSVIERCRFDSCTLMNSGFDRVLIVDSDLSGVSFRHCLLRNCLITGIKARFNLLFDDCILDRVMLARSHVDHLQFDRCRIARLDVLNVEANRIDFRDCSVFKRKGQVSFEECQLSKLNGLDTLGKSGITVHVDAPLWQSLGDHYLGLMGFEPLDTRDARRPAAGYAVLDDIAEQLGQREP